VKAKQLINATITEENKTLDWSAYEKRQVMHTQPINLKKETWALVYSQRDYESANNLVTMMRKASGGFGIKVDEPQYVELANQNDYKSPIAADIDPQYTVLVVVILNRKEAKPPIKK
jgi:hypothetical protein